jgi:hypothetical protein
MTQTKCSHCIHAVEVLEPDRFGIKRVSLEVAHCAFFSQFRSLRIVRACVEFKLKKEAALPP